MKDLKVFINNNLKNAYTGEAMSAVVTAVDSVEAIELVQQELDSNPDLSFEPNTFKEVYGNDEAGIAVTLLGKATDGIPGLYLISNNNINIGTTYGMLKVEKDTVLQTAKDLCKRNGGKTTNLDIKRVLRTNGYYVTQHIVSEIMDQNYEQEGFSFDFNGQFRVYYLDQPTYQSSPATTTTGRKVAQPTKTNTKPLLPIISMDMTDQDSWEANYKDGTVFYYYPSEINGTEINSDDVRNSLAKELQTKMQDIRARRCKRSVNPVYTQ